MNSELERIIKEIEQQDGTDAEAPELTEEEWAKVKTLGDVGFGSPVRVVFVKEYDAIEDSGYLMAIPGCSDDWELGGIVHIPEPYVEKERTIPEWHSLYSLCKNQYVKEIVIGNQP